MAHLGPPGISAFPPPVEQHPRYRDAVAQRGEAARQLDHTVVKAPFAGIVTMCPCPCSKIRSAGKA
jgi:hypothetical protein